MIVGPQEQGFALDARGVRWGQRSRTALLNFLQKPESSVRSYNPLIGDRPFLVQIALGITGSPVIALDVIDRWLVTAVGAFV